MTERATIPAPERRCILCGTCRPRCGMIRLVLSPDDIIVPDLAEKLPGRGLWICADRRAVDAASDARRLEKAVARSLRRRLPSRAIAPDLAERIDRLLTRRVQDRLGLARRAGHIVTGFEKVAAGLRAGRADILLEATDAAEDGCRKLRALAAPAVDIVRCLTRDEMGLALGRGNVVHAALAPGGGADAFLRDLRRLQGWRGKVEAAQALADTMPDAAMTG